MNTQLKFKTETKQGFNAIVEIDNKFLQRVVDEENVILASLGTDGFWVVTGIGHLWLKVIKDEIYLECISVDSDERRKGYGKQLMQFLTNVSNETGVSIKLEVSVVGNGGATFIPNVIVGIGMNKKNKIPVQSLPAWYEKQGFTKSPSYSAKKKSMIYLPKK